MNLNKSSKIGLIAFANRSGLGAQTRRLAEMIKPDRILVVNSSYFSQNWQQNYDWYKPYQFFISEGFPSNDDVQKFIHGLTHVFTCENPYNFNLIYWAKRQGTKTYVQSNYEFCDNLDKPYLPIPTKFLMPSYWKIAEMKKLFGEDRVGYLPPPINPAEFNMARQVNMARKGRKPRFLHPVGTPATKDRNGTLDVLDAVKLTRVDFELVIKSQHPMSASAFLDDPRVKYEFNDVATNEELFVDFDAVILPRRYGGLCLSCNEALMSGLPVIMTNVSPNNQLLPKEWLVDSSLEDHVQVKTKIDVYSVVHQELANKIEEMVSWDFSEQKKAAYELAVSNFDMETLRPRYDLLWN